MPATPVPARLARPARSPRPHWRSRGGSARSGWSAGALGRFGVLRGHAGLGRGWLAPALSAAGPSADSRLRAVALDGAGQLAYVQADHDTQRIYQEESLAIWRELGDDARVASCLGDLGAAAHV